ncbi:MAG TPA: SUMF1/EgtB/PvdO family nonheme iron enzyme [Blastocatellia bacterium]|nr:SUMF1/EgtB/PvdO family nonheme iron enzyme [Blastocatellia bacterium]
MKTCTLCSKTYGDDLQVCPVDQGALVAASSEASDAMVGRLLAGRYRLEKKIGEGGMGAIYRAVHTEMGRPCAIKLLTLLSGNDDALARFKREAKMASSIDNAHAVTIYDFGRSEDGMLFLAMELIDGVALSRVLSQERTLQAARAIHIAGQIAEALAAAHSRGIIHRDLKPDNIMITRKGASADYVKVLDFGIAKTVAEDNADNLTKPGFVLGTPVYMSPEQLLGEKLDPRSDIYSLAIIVYEMLSGRLPFEGDNQQSIMMKRITNEPVRISWVVPTVSEALERAVMNGLARDPAARTRTVEAFAASLNTALLSGTQVLGGRATERLGGGDPVLSTKEWGGLETHPDGPAVTSLPPATRSTDPESLPASAHQPTPNPAPNVADHIAAVNAQPTQLSAQQVRPGPRPQPASVAQPASVVVASEPKKRSPLLLLGGVLALVIIALVAYLLLSSGSAPTLMVRGAPAGSEVFVNGATKGTVAADGTLKVPGLVAGTAMVRVKKDGFADFDANIDLRKGREEALEALLLPNQMNYRGADMILIPAGQFLMGDDNHFDDEKPAHTVDQPAFYIDKYEVTNEQYKRFCDAEKSGRYPETAVEKDYLLNNPTLPAVGIQYEDAAAYARWAGRRLPAEEEWEKAASWDPKNRAKRQWPWGDKPGGASANLGRNQVPKLAAVGTYAGDVSAYGIHDLAGNVSEWVDTFYNAYEGNPQPTPKKDTEFGSKFRVTRGGSIRSDIDQARTTFRGLVPLEVTEENRKYMLVGIRCAVSANDPRIQEFLRSRIN